MIHGGIAGWVVVGCIVLGFLGYVVAAGAYIVFAPWHESSIGRQFALLLATLAATFGLMVLELFVGELNSTALRLTVFGLFALSGCGLAVSVIRTQVKNRDGLKASAKRRRDAAE